MLLIEHSTFQESQIHLGQHMKKRVNSNLVTIETALPITALLPGKA